MYHNMTLLCPSCGKVCNERIYIGAIPLVCRCGDCDRVNMVILSDVPEVSRHGN